MLLTDLAQVALLGRCCALLIIGQGRWEVLRVTRRRGYRQWGGSIMAIHWSFLAAVVQTVLATQFLLCQSLAQKPVIILIASVIPIHSHQVITTTATTLLEAGTTSPVLAMTVRGVVPSVVVTVSFMIVVITSVTIPSIIRTTNGV